MSQLDALLAESGLDHDDDLRDLLAPLQELATTAPAPTPALGAVLGGVRPLVQLPSRSARAARATASAVVAGVLSITGTGLAAAANTLPAPLQHRVSDFSHRYLPFDFPRPVRGAAPGLAPAPTPASVPGEVLSPSNPPLRLRTPATGSSTPGVVASPTGSGDARAQVAPAVRRGASSTPSASAAPTALTPAVTADPAKPRKDETADPGATKDARDVRDKDAPRSGKKSAADPGDQTAPQTGDESGEEAGGAELLLVPLAVASRPRAGAPAPDPTDPGEVEAAVQPALRGGAGDDDRQQGRPAAKGGADAPGRGRAAKAAAPDTPDPVQDDEGTDDQGQDDQDSQ